MFGLHPALLDAALHAARLAGGTGTPDGIPDGAGAVRLPFAWTGVSLHATGASALRVRLRAEGDQLFLAAADDTGAPVVAVGSLVSRPVAAERLAAAGAGLQDALFGVEWVPVPASQEGTTAGTAAAVGQWALVGADQLGLAGAGLRGLPGPGRPGRGRGGG